MNLLTPSLNERVLALRLTNEDHRVEQIAEDLRKAITSEDALARTDSQAKIVATHIGRIEIYLHGLTVVANLEYLRSGDERLGGQYKFFLVREDVLGRKTAERVGAMEFNENGMLRLDETGEWIATIMDRDPDSFRFRGLLVGHVAHWVHQRMSRLA